MGSAIRGTGKKPPSAVPVMTNHLCLVSTKLLGEISHNFTRSGAAPLVVEMVVKVVETGRRQPPAF